MVLRGDAATPAARTCSGLNNLLADIERGGIRMADERAFSSA